MPVPALLGRIRHPSEDILLYEDVFVSGRCSLLLGDLIAQADREPAVIPRVEELIDGACGDLCAAAARTGEIRELAACVPHLYTGRLRPGGRIESWYLRDDLPVHQETGRRLTLRDLADYHLAIGERTYRLDIEQILKNLRSALSPASQWVTAITQGDPTEPNIAWPRCWLDFEHAGRNTLAGEIANMLWYLLALGGWLVPRHQPDVYARTTRLALPPVATPTITAIHAAHDARRITVDWAWHTGAGRDAAITRLVSWIGGELGAAAQLQPGDEMAQLRGFLALRILGVIPPTRLTADEALLIIAKLAESQHPATSLATFARTEAIPSNR
jgi:hypothetical protein